MTINHGGGKLKKLSNFAKEHGAADALQRMHDYVDPSDENNDSGIKKDWMSLKGNLNKGVDQIKPAKSLPETAKKKLTEEILEGKSVVNKIGIFGPDTYKYLIYVILFLNICCIILLTFNKTKFFKYEGDVEVDVRLNKNVFYIYIFILFLLILQLYTLKENYDIILKNRGPYQAYIEGFNILCIFGLSYFIYKQIDFMHTPCPEPNKNVCVANSFGPNEIGSCKNGPFKCGDKDEKDYDCGNENCDADIAANFYLDPNAYIKINNCSTFESECPLGEVMKPNPENLVCAEKACTPTDCCATETEISTTSGYNYQDMVEIITNLFNDLIKPDEEKIKNLETKYDSLSPGEGIPGPAGPAGPAGPPGTPGSDTRSDISSPSSNQFSNILCPNEPGGLCTDGETRCDDKGMCEGFALISLQDKIDLKLKYKDLNNNTYKVNNLMNNLETFLLNSLK